MQVQASNVAREEYLKLVPLATAKSWLKVQHDAEDELITDCIIGVIQMAESFCGIDFVPKTRTVFFEQSDYLNYDGTYRLLSLPYGPNQQVSAVYRIIGTDEEEVTVDAYEISGLSYRTIALNRFWSTRSYNGVNYRIEYTSGQAFEADSTTYSDLRIALLQCVDNFYRNRSHAVQGTIVTNVPLSARVVLNQYIRTW